MDRQGLYCALHMTTTGKKGKSLGTLWGPRRRDPEAWKVGVLALSPGWKEPWSAALQAFAGEHFSMAFGQFWHPLSLHRVHIPCSRYASHVQLPFYASTPSGTAWLPHHTCTGSAVSALCLRDHVLRNVASSSTGAVSSKTRPHHLSRLCIAIAARV